MGKFFANLPNLVIASGATDTTTAITSYITDADSITITAPAALTGTVTIRVANDTPAEGGGTPTYKDLMSGGSAVTITTNDLITITDVGFNSLKVTSGSAEASTRTFTVSKQWKAR